MLSSRGWWLLIAVLVLLALALRARYTTLVLLALALVLWFFWEWLWFALRARLVVRRLRLHREVRDDRGPVDNLWRGRVFQVHVELRLSGRLTLPFALVTDRVPLGTECTAGETESDGELGADRPLSLSYHLRCLTVGRVRFEGLGLQLADLQGFFYHRTFLPGVTIYRVLPPLADTEGHAPTVKRHNLLPSPGIHRFRRPGTGSELLDLRDYLPGDPPKTIAWKVSARRDRLITKEFESEVPVRCTLFVDTSHAVRLGPPGQNALARLVELAAAVAQATGGVRDLTGLCRFDERSVATYIRPARGARHLVRMLNVLADAAGLAPATGQAPLPELLRLAHALAQEVYPYLMRPEINTVPFWLPWVWAQPAYTIQRPTLADRVHRWFPLVSYPRRLRYRWRKRLAALLSVQYGLAPGGLSVLMEDDERMAQYLQRFLADHHVPYPLPLYDDRGRYLFASPGKVDVLATALLRAVGKGHDNELFVLLVDLLELVDQLAPLLRAVKVTLARHHQVVLICPWPPGVPPPGTTRPPDRPLSTARKPEDGLGVALHQATVTRFHRAYHQLRRTFARYGVPVVCAATGDPARLILQRLERLRAQGRRPR
jgi:uncharacterized protein (DUF58 family)